jgi:hypothetical protein
VIADDVGLVDAGEGGPASVVPSHTRLRLWRDALVRLGISPSALMPALTGAEAFFLDCGRPATHGRFVLGAVVVLSRRGGGPVEFQRVRGARTVGALYGVVHTRRPAGALARGPDIFRAVTRLAASGLSIWDLRLPEDPASLRLAAADVLTVLEQ